MLTEPKLQPARCSYYLDQKGFRLLEDYVFSIPGGGVMTIPKDFWYNAGSIPWLFWQVTFSPYDPDILAATLIHDWCYTTHCVDKATADTMLENYLSHEGYTKRAAVVGNAVKVFGKWAWNQDRNDLRYLNQLRATLANSGRSTAKYGL